MRAAIEQNAFHRRLKSQWKQEMRKYGRSRKVGAQGKWLRSSTGMPTPVMHAAVWAMAFFPSYLGFLLMISLSLLCTLLRATSLDRRGTEEVILFLYGGSDRDILSFGRRILWQMAAWSMADAIIISVIWIYTDRFPWWSAAIAVPCYVLGSIAGPVLLARFIPSLWLVYLLLASIFSLIAGAIVRTYLSPEIADGLTWAVGISHPAGWTLLMMRDLGEGHWYLLGVIPLSLAAVWLARSALRDLESRRLANLAMGDETRDAEPVNCTKAVDDISGSQAFSVQFGEEIERFRKGSLLEMTPLDPPVRQISRITRSLAMLFVAALATRFPATLPSSAVHLVFFGLLLVILARSFPFLGVPGWFQFVFLSTNRVASAFTLLPISCSQLMREQIWEDLRKVGFAALWVPWAVAASVIMVLPHPWLQAGCFGLLLVVIFALKVPIKWHNLSLRPLANKRFGWIKILHGILLLVLAISLTLEGILVITTIAILQQGVFEVWWVMAGCVGVGVINAALALAGTFLNVSAFERGVADAVKMPPRSG